MRTRPHFLHLLTGGDYFEPPDRYAVKHQHFIAYTLGKLPAGWRHKRNGMWFHCFSPKDTKPRHGWKIHVSATPKNAPDILTTILPVLFEHDTSFKFTADGEFLRYSLSKICQRGASGKFITVYPRDSRSFVELMAALHQVTAQFDGPYILSDRRYKDNKILYYRYGSILPRQVLRADGTTVGVIDAPDGTEIVDERHPYFQHPDWVQDPFPQEPAQDSTEPGTLKDGRYAIDHAIAFTNSGGVFVAFDRERRMKVIIKEARPLVSWTPQGDEARETLRREYRILQRLSGTGVTPEPIDYFVDWEHEFLVEELFEGRTIREAAAQTGVLLRTRADEASWQAWYDVYRRTFLSAAEALRRIHERGILFLDVAPGNIFVTTDGEVKFIDLETAVELGVDEPGDVGTPGYRAHEKQTKAGGTVESDFYSFGAVMLSELFPIGGMFELDRMRVAEIVREVARDARLPAPVTEAILGAFSSEPRERTSLSQFTAVLDANPRIAPRAEPSSLDLVGRLADVSRMRDRVAEYIVATATPRRDDRLFPSDFRLFSTNRLGLAYGATGTLAALRRIGHDVPQRFTDWVCERLPEADALVPGFGTGRAGIAWALRELGLEREAGRLLSAGAHDMLLDQAHGLFYGCAGWGLSNLHAFISTHDEAYLVAAIAAAEKLARHAKTDPEGHLYWTDDTTAGAPTPYGLMHGASGIALFMLYLAQATDQQRFLELGIQAVEYDIAHKQITADGAASWHYRSDFDRIVSPYWEYGSAGVGAAVLRYAVVTGERRYFELYDQISIDGDRKYTIMTGKLMGLAGIGGAHLDAFRFTGDPRYRAAALKACEGIELYRIERAEGIAFPSSLQQKIASDWGYGLAGVALFLDRLATGKASEFLLDELLPAPVEILR